MKITFKFFTTFLFLIFLSCSKKEKSVKVVTNDSISKKHQIVDSRNDSIRKKTLFKLKRIYEFDNYPIKLYSGNLAKPNFKNDEFANDKEYIEFIKKGCKENGINYAGHYTIIQMSCGCMCEHFFMIDRITGEIHNDFKPDQDGCYGYLYKKNSILIIGNSSAFVDDKHEYYGEPFEEPVFYLWKKDNFIQLK